MAARAEREDFEVAAVLRDSIAAVERTLAKQHIVQDDFVDQDVWGLYREADVVEVVVLFVRGGKLVGRRAFQQKDQELPDADGDRRARPAVLRDRHVHPRRGRRRRRARGRATCSPSGSATARGKKVKIVEPRRGMRARLVELADRNAAASATSRRSKDADAEALLAKVAERPRAARGRRGGSSASTSRTSRAPTRSPSMVTFVDGVPARGAVSQVQGPRRSTNNDFAAMYEVLTRRFARGGTRGGDDDPAWAHPDLLVIDGGKGQLGMAVAALTDLGVPLGGETGLEVIGLAKERELEAGSAPDRIYRRNVKDSIALRANSPGALRARADPRRGPPVREHVPPRSPHARRACASELDAIPGIGATRRQRLLKHFGSVRAVRQATVDELAKAPGMNRKAAEQITRYFREREPEGQPAPPAEATQLTESRAEIDRDFDANVEGRSGDADIDAELRPEEEADPDPGDDGLREAIPRASEP